MTRTCPACLKNWSLCTCALYCDECRITTNHTGAQHRAAQEEDEREG